MSLIRSHVNSPVWLHNHRPAANVSKEYSTPLSVLFQCRLTCPASMDLDPALSQIRACLSILARDLQGE